MATVTAQLNNLRQSPRKVRMVVDVVKGKGVLKALQQLEFVIRRPSQPVSKLIRSAIANAENNFNMVASNLYIKEFRVDEGVKLKRFRPKAMGAVGEVQKKTSHIYLVLAEKVPGLKRSADRPAAERPRSEVDEALSRRDKGTDSTKGNFGTGTGKQGPVSASQQKGNIGSGTGKKIVEPKKGLRKMFQRKSI